MPSSDVTTYCFALIHEKSKTRFSSGKPRNIVWKCLHDTEQLTELLYSFDQSCLKYSEPVVIQTRSQSRNEIYTHTERLVKKHNNFLYLKRSYLVLNEEKRKQGNKKEKLTESLHLTVKIARRSNYNIDLRKQNHRPPKPQSGSK